MVMACSRYSLVSVFTLLSHNTGIAEITGVFCTVMLDVNSA